MNISYRVIDPSTSLVRDQGLFNSRSPDDRRHFNRVANQAYSRGMLVMTMATGHQAAMFREGAAAGAIDSMSQEIA